MALRSVGRVGMDVGSRVACASRRRTVMHSCSSISSPTRTVSSLVGPGQGHFGRSRAPPCTPGSSGSSTQLFKLVETDLMAKELTRYESWDAQPLGLHCVEDVLAELTAATAELSLAPATGDPQPPSDLENSASGATAPSIGAAEVLAAWGQGPRLRDELPQAPAVQEGQGVVAPTACGEAEDVGVEKGVGKMAIKRTYQPHTIKRKRKHGFLYRSKTRLGKKILKRRQEKGRSRLGI